MLGLLAFGLGQLGAAYYQKQAQEKLQGLLGTPETARAGEEGPVQVPGTGLMADPSDLNKQMEFARGLLATPGGGAMLAKFAPMLQQAIQSKQFQQSEGRQADQFNRTEQRMGTQWQSEFDANKAYRDQQQANWQASFDQNAAQAAFQRQMEGARLQLARANADDERAYRQAQLDKKDSGMGAMPAGYGVVETASGKSLMPMPGTKDFATVKEGYGATQDAISNIEQYMDLYLGKETKTPGGNTVREGGMGSEWTGAGYAAMNAKRNAIIASLGKARDMGVLQEGEYKRLADSIPEADAWFSKPKKFEAAMSGVRDEFRQKLVRQREANPWLVPPPPPGYR